MRLELPKSTFHQDERPFVTSTQLTVSTFTFPTGVEALRVRTQRASLVVLPYLGQQIWSATLDGHELGMKSMVHYPKKGVPLLENLGGFFFHCGLTAIAAPGEGDDHALHGELPSAEFDRACLEITGEDGMLAVTIKGSFEYAKAFSSRYRFNSSITIQQGEAAFDINVEVNNLKTTPMDLCYLGHINFRPVDGSSLIYSAPYTPAAVAVRSAIPAHLTPSDEYRTLLSDLAEDPARHHAISETTNYDPEVVFKIGYLADDEGWAHALQRHGDGTADWVAHRPDQLPHAFRWFSRTPDQDCLAMTEPATCGIDGYSAEKKQGRVPTLAGQETWSARMRVGRLTSEQADELISDIDRICDRT
ncbi:DUF4432 family protein (plasmid) [Rhizobium ruizarguesonis]|uniref:DUF4432 family protein n=2 Tax=Rhizobium TaxID=379 RepID=A0A179BRN4_RHILE|nr:DUF4432 family protein [Rhizobium leguminosarum]OAP93751.1 hypothetical protein A4U53_23590 [Rhizobium leguminosarum]